jgi:hypothetical protein
MSWTVQQAIFHSDLPGITKNRMQAKLVLVSLAHFTDDAGEHAWPAVATVAKLASCSVRTVQGLIKTLVGAGLLEQQAPACRHRPTTYRVNLTRLGVQTAAPVTSLSEVQPAAPLRHGDPQQSAPLESVGVQSSADRGAEPGALGVQTAAGERTYGNLKTNLQTDQRESRILDARTLAKHAYDQLTPPSLARLERDARRELDGLLALQPPETVPVMIRNQVQLYLRDPRVRQEFLGAPPGTRQAICAA